MVLRRFLLLLTISTLFTRPILCQPTITNDNDNNKNTKLEGDLIVVDNEFIFPPPAYTPSDDVVYVENLVFTAGQKMMVRWRTNYTSFKLVSVRRDGEGGEGEGEEEVIFESNATSTSAPHAASSYSWDVWSDIPDPMEQPVYLVIYNTDGGDNGSRGQSFRSRSFNITGEGERTSATDMDILAPPPPPPFEDDVVEEAAEEEEGDGGDHNRALKLGLGIGLGLGLGIPLVVVGVLLIGGVLICRAVALDYNPGSGDAGSVISDDYGSVVIGVGVGVLEAEAEKGVEKVV
ncbi:hypothetical protein TWF730_005287 [Orbilia blumenaviensis]|uniref:Uncharacterized protein n=1 Tax=Orbilia blumenaviensis TaxID=1796055 RepID=A0AAV9VHY1_9PEZI